jgi:DNA-binding LytR/AlgR family response regulator
MRKPKILVVEDEILIADNICSTLRDLGYDALEPAISYTEAMVTIKKEKPDIAILDIHLSGIKTGIDIAKQIRDFYDFPFIFLTANSDLVSVNAAKEVMPQAYLIKPFSKEELFTSIEIALHNFSQVTGRIDNEKVIIRDSLFVKEKGFYNKIIFDDILYLKSAHVYIEIIQTNTQKIVIRTSLNEIIEKLDSNFIRIHRSYIINTKYLKHISAKSVVINDVTLPIGKMYNDNLVKKINLL